MPSSNRSPVQTIAFISIAAVGLLAYGFTLEMRYMWFLQPQDAMIVRAVEIAVLVLCLVLWNKFPSPLAVLVVAVGGLAVPPLIHERVFVGWDVPFVLLASIPVSLLFAATYIRQKWVVARKEGKSESVAL